MPVNSEICGGKISTSMIHSIRILVIGLAVGLTLIFEGLQTFSKYRALARTTTKRIRDISTGEINGQIVGARQNDLVESFIHDEICFAIPDSRKNSKIYHPHSGLTLKRGQEILAKDWFTCYLSMVRGEDCT